MPENQTPTREEIYELLKRCDKDNPKAEDVKALRHVLATAGTAYLKTVTDLAQNNIDNILSDKKYRATMRELTRATLNHKRQELGYETSPMLERMLIDAILLAWLRYQEFEYIFTSMDPYNMTLTKAAFWEKRLSASLARYLKTCETLARVRKLTSPIVQVNVAQEGSQQLNVAGDLVKS